MRAAPQTNADGAFRAASISDCGLNSIADAPSTAALGRSPHAEDERVALAAATAQGGGTGSAAAAAQFEGEGEDQPGAAHADRVAEGDGAAVDVKPVQGQAEIPRGGEHDSSEGLVDLDQDGFHPACRHHLGLPGHDLLSGLRDRGQTRKAQLVNRSRGHAHRDAARGRAQPGRVRARTGLHRMAQDHRVDLGPR